MHIWLSVHKSVLTASVSITSGEIELAACAFADSSFIVLPDDGKVYRIMEKVGINFISSVNIVVDAYFTQHHDKKQAHAMLEKLRISFSDDVIDKAQEVIVEISVNIENDYIKWLQEISHENRSG